MKAKDMPIFRNEIKTEQRVKEKKFLTILKISFLLLLL